MPATKRPKTIEEMCVFLEGRGRGPMLKATVFAAHAAGVDEVYLSLLKDAALVSSGAVDELKASIVAWCKANDGKDLAVRLLGEGKGKERTQGEWDRWEERKPSKEIVERSVATCHEVAVVFLREAGVERNSDTAKAFFYGLLAIAAPRPKTCRKYLQEVANAAFRVAVGIERKPADQIVHRIMGILQGAAATD